MDRAGCARGAERPDRDSINAYAERVGFLRRQSRQNFEVLGLVNSSGIVLIVNRGGVQSVGRWLRIEENPVM
jgi:hypothetical protein